nr:hypothetical protein JVH1_4424 [Rhodococcus sp. JVH1]
MQERHRSQRRIAMVKQTRKPAAMSQEGMSAAKVIAMPGSGN